MLVCGDVRSCVRMYADVCSCVGVCYMYVRVCGCMVMCYMYVAVWACGCVYGRVQVYTHVHTHLLDTPNSVGWPSYRGREARGRRGMRVNLLAEKKIFLCPDSLANPMFVCETAKNTRSEAMTRSNKLIHALTETQKQDYVPTLLGLVIKVWILEVGTWLMFTGVFGTLPL